MINEKMKTAAVPGLAIAVVDKDGVIYENGYGTSGTWEGAEPASTESPFYIGSLTKTLTGVLIMKIVEEGLLDLDTPIVKYIPWFTLEDEEAANAVTTRMLLSHTSGLPHVFEAFGSMEPDGLEKLVRSLPQYNLLFAPGKTWCYSDLGIDTAGYVAEAVTGKYYADLVKEYVFEPLGMTNSGFDHTAFKELSQLAGLPGNSAHLPSSFAISSTSDMGKFVQMLLKEGDGFLSAESIKEMYTIHGDYYLPDRSGYGLAIEVDYFRSVKRLWHDGAVQNYGAWMYAVPDSEIGVVLLTNGRHGFWDSALDIIASIFNEYIREDSTDSTEPYNGPVIRPELCEGTYTGAWKGYVSVREADGQLYFKLNGEETVLAPFGRDRFIGMIDGEQVSVGFHENGEDPVTQIMVDGVTCEKVSPIPDYEYDPGHLLDFIGIYKKNSDLLQFHVINKTLHCYDQYDDASHECKIISYDTVVAGNVLITFDRKQCGEPTGILVNKSVHMPRS
ncbi:serine hydrolase domain-containing protein [Fictibacillus aquaticus]